MALPIMLTSACGRRPEADVDFVSALEALITVPAFESSRPASVSSMESSYDRTGGNVDWADPRELWIGDDDYQLADLRGPGCLRRIWKTNVRAEEWRFYFDNEKRPRITIARTNLFPSGQRVGLMPFVPPLAGGMSGGAFSYIPLPYQTRLRIVVRKPHTGEDARPYFHINYETYSAGTRVKSYPRRLSEADREAVRKVQQVWDNNHADMQAVANRMDWRTVVLEPETEHVFFDLSGQGGIIETLAVRLEPLQTMNAVQRAQALRQLVLTAVWDEADFPSVEVPVGDFFCNGLHARRFASLVLANVDGSYISRFPMPFGRAARLSIRNDGALSIPVSTAVEWSGDPPPEDRRYFHAGWNSDLSPGHPFRIMQTEGRGVFLGAYLIALGMERGWNILEGDEFFYRDGNTMSPVHHGTGLEDYFNAGWYYSGLFEQPLHGLTEKAAMRTAQYRLQIPDPVTFKSSLDAQIEFGHGNYSQGYKSAAAYWYQDRPGPSNSDLPPWEQRFPPLVDEVKVAAIMSELFELERMGLDLELEERCAYYAGRFEGQPLGEIMNLRGLAYREIREGPEAVRDAYRAIIEDETVHPDVAAQARLLLWRTEAPFRALFGGSGYCEFRLFLNGQPVGNGGNPFTYEAFPVELSPGSHLLQAEVVSRGDHSWYTFGFFSDFTNVVSDVSWDYSDTRPQNWPLISGTSPSWQPYSGTPGMFPTMQWWRFAPNAWPLVQSGFQIGGAFPNWEQPARRTIYLRRRIDVPESPEFRHSPFVRRHRLLRPPLRPEDDTSNQHL